MPHASAFETKNRKVAKMAEFSKKVLFAVVLLLENVPLS